MEAALDLGKVVAGDNQEEICELELELRQGDAAALLELAAELAADLPLMPCDISKAERGYRLFDPNSYEVDPRPRNCWRKPRWTVPSPPSPGTCSAAASDWPNSIASTARRLLEDWLQHLQDLRTLLGSLGQAVPRASSRELREALDALLADWAPRIERGRDDETLRQQAPQLFRGELDETRWGLFSLNASRWLLAKAWTESRNERGNRQGSAALGKGCCAALPKKPLARPPASRALPDQAPRLQRMLTWLRLARGVLDLPEADRLYGELAKLLEPAATCRCRAPGCPRHAGPYCADAQTLEGADEISFAATAIIRRESACPCSPPPPRTACWTSATCSASGRSGPVGQEQAEQCLAIRRSAVRNQQHPLEFLAAQQVEDLKRPGRKLDLETLTQWLAEYAGQPYLRIDPLKIDVAAVTPLMSYAFAQRHGIPPSR